jgi:hypothetical protein
MGKVALEKRIFPLGVENKRFVRDIAGSLNPSVSGFSSSG